MSETERIEAGSSWKSENEAAQRVYDILEDRLSRISDEIGHEESDPTESSRFKMLESAWTECLEGLGLKRTVLFALTQKGLQKRVAREYSRCEVWLDHYRISDPLYVTGGFIEVPKELATKILTLGFLP
jgi:hypothetical protein